MLVFVSTPNLVVQCLQDNAFVLLSAAVLYSMCAYCFDVNVLCNMVNVSDANL